MKTLILFTLFPMIVTAQKNHACDQIRSRLFGKKEIRLLIIHFFRIEQKEMEDCHRQFLRMRDFYKNEHQSPCHAAAVYALGTILSSSQNATLTTEACVGDLGLNSKSFPNFIPVTNSQNDSSISLTKLWMEYAKYPGTATAIHRGKLNINFGYCDTPKIKLERPWHISTYLSLSRPFLWLLLLSTSILVSIILNFEYLNQGMGTSESYLLTISGFIGTPSLKPGRNSIILVIWMLACQVIQVMYSGTITSRIIAPIEESQMTSVSELLANKFKLIFAFNETRDFIKTTSIGYFGHHKPNLKTTSNSLLEDIMALRNLFTSDVIVTGNLDECISGLTGGQKFAVAGSWTLVIDKVSKANAKLKREGKLDRYHCYLGKRLVAPTESYCFVFCPPKVDCILHSVIQRLQETGIYVFWTTEYIKSKYSNRVQDRIKVISPTKMKYIFESDTAKSIKLEGRISKIFTVWFIGLIVSLIRAIFEIVVGIKTKGMNV